MAQKNTRKENRTDQREWRVNVVWMWFLKHFFPFMFITPTEIKWQKWKKKERRKALDCFAWSHDTRNGNKFLFHNYIYLIWLVVGVTRLQKCTQYECEWYERQAIFHQSVFFNFRKYYKLIICSAQDIH